MTSLLQSLRSLLTLRWLTGRNAVIAVPALFLTAAFLVPFLIVLRISLSDMDTRAARSAACCRTSTASSC